MQGLLKLDTGCVRILLFCAIMLIGSYLGGGGLNKDNGGGNGG